MDKKVKFTDSSFLADKNVKIVTDKSQATRIIKEENITTSSFAADEHLKVVDESWRADEKIFIEKASSGWVGPFIIIVLVIGVLIAPFITFGALPGWGKALVILALINCLFVLVESIVAFVKTRKQHITKTYYRKMMINMIVAISLFVISYLAYGVMTLIQFGKHSSNNYIGSDFTAALITLMVFVLGLDILTIISRTTAKRKESSINPNPLYTLKVFLFPTIVLTAAVFLTGVLGAASGEETSQTRSLVQIGDCTNCDVNNSYLNITYVIENRTNNTIYTFKEITLRLYDNNTNERVANGYFQNVKINGGLKGNDYTNITFSFSFANGEANYDYWHSQTTLNVWASAHFSWN